MRRLVLCAVVAGLSALIGPRVIGPQNRSAGQAFAYEPPEGFTPTKAEGAQAWVHQESEIPTARTKQSVRAVVTHSNKEMAVDELELARVTSEMAKAFEDVCRWEHRRHEMRVRPDGARVGLIEGDCDQEMDLGAFGLPKTKTRSRKLQLVFPDDTGTSIVTISYPTEQAARWEPIFEATIAKARGVATRVPSPPAWMYFAFGAAGAVLAWLATALFARKSP